MWQSPWDNAVPGGDQLTRAIWAMATGGWFGTGLGLGDSRYLPAGHTDLILAAIGEELGAAGLTIVAVLYAILAWRGFASHASHANDYGFFLATALTLFLIVPGSDHGVGHPGRDAADGRRDAVSQLRRIGDGRELRGARGCSRRSMPTGIPQPISNRSGSDLLARRSAGRVCARAAVR